MKGLTITGYVRMVTLLSMMIQNVLMNKELKKKYDDLKIESKVLQQEIDEKTPIQLKQKNLYIKLKYDYYKLTDQWETLNEENMILKTEESKWVYCSKPIG